MLRRAGCIARQVNQRTIASVTAGTTTQTTSVAPAPFAWTADSAREAARVPAMDRKSAIWATTQGSTLETRPNYSATDCFETFVQPASIEAIDSFGRQLATLPEPTRRLLQLAAADP